MATLKILTFWLILKTNKIELLDSSYKKGKKYTEEQLFGLAQLWNTLYDEFSEKRKDKSGKYLMKKNFELMEISLKLELLHDMQNRLMLLLELHGNHLKEFRETRRREIILEFKDLYPKVKFNIFIEIEEILTLVQSVIKSQNNIFTEKNGVQDKNIDKQERTIEYVISILGKNLGYNIDAQTMTCEDFLAKEQLVEEINAKITTTTKNNNK